MMTSAVVGEPVSHAVVKTATKQTYLGHNEDMLLKLQRTNTVLAGDNTQKASARDCVKSYSPVLNNRLIVSRQYRACVLDSGVVRLDPNLIHTATPVWI
jgi:hypothetical protein